MDFQHGRGERALLLKRERKSVVSNFGQSFCYFRHSKSVLETAETKQVDSQLWFAPKIIKIHLVVWENELLEVAWTVSKTSQKQKHTHHAHIDIIAVRKHP